MTKRTPRTFTFPVCDDSDTPIPGCTVTYHREDGYAAYFAGQLIGYADSKLEAEAMSREARLTAMRG